MAKLGWRAANATALALSVTALVSCGNDAPGNTQGAGPTSTTSARASTTPNAPAREREAAEVGSEGPGNAREPRSHDEPAEPHAGAPDARDDASDKRVALRAAVQAYEDYIDAINGRDGARLCDLLPPGAERTLKPAVEGASCAARVGNSIGYEDPRGFPVWKETTLSAFDSTAISRDLDSARLTAAIVTGFADRTEPSVESDIVYLERVAGSWRLAKPTGALYRAIGQPEIPPSVISPP